MSIAAGRNPRFQLMWHQNLANLGYIFPRSVRICTKFSDCFNPLLFTMKPSFLSRSDVHFCSRRPISEILNQYWHENIPDIDNIPAFSDPIVTKRSDFSKLCYLNIHTVQLLPKYNYVTDSIAQIFEFSYFDMRCE